MASDPDFVAFVCDQMSAAGTIESRRMFGEAAVYCGSKVVALVCDNRLFVKPTAAGRAFIGTPVEAPAYPGGKPWFLIADLLDNRDWLSKLIVLTADELPLPKPKPGRAHANGRPTRRPKSP